MEAGVEEDVDEDDVLEEIVDDEVDVVILLVSRDSAEEEDMDDSRFVLRLVLVDEVVLVGEVVLLDEVVLTVLDTEEEEDVVKLLLLEVAVGIALLGVTDHIQETT